MQLKELLEVARRDRKIKSKFRVTDLVKPFPPMGKQRLQNACLEAIKNNLVESAHDVSEGGLAVALAECCFLNPKANFGATVNVEIKDRPDFGLFGEDQSRIVLSLNENSITPLHDICRRCQIPMKVIGRVGGASLAMNDLINAPISTLESIYRNSIRNKMED